MQLLLKDKKKLREVKGYSVKFLVTQGRFFDSKSGNPDLLRGSDNIFSANITQVLPTSSTVIFNFTNFVETQFRRGLLLLPLLDNSSFMLEHHKTYTAKHTKIINI